MTDVAPCWNRIGVYGDATCPELIRHVHCRSCPVFGTAGPQLLERPAPPGYAREAGEAVSRPKDIGSRRDASVLVFRLGAEWVAFDTRRCTEVTTLPPIHTVPHRTGRHLAGLANVRGTLVPCIAIRSLLSIEPVADTRSSARLVVIARDEALWAFVADEVLGVEHYALTDVREVPATLQRGVGSLARCLFPLGDRLVGHLDDERLFAAFERCVE
jgi:chemotaxis-related protein WspD